MSVTPNFKQRTYAIIQSQYQHGQKPKTAYIRTHKRANKLSLQSSKFRSSETSPNTIKFENQQQKNKILHSQTKKTSIKLKLLRSKKRKVSKCQLGIGYQSQPYQMPKSKLRQQKFPQRSLVMFNRLAFKNLKAKEGLYEKLSYERQKISPKTEKQGVQNDFNQVRSSFELKNNSQAHLKIVSLGQTFYFKAKPYHQIVHRNNSKFHNSRGTINFYERCSYSHFHNKQKIVIPNRVEAISPWEFEQIQNCIFNTA